MKKNSHPVKVVEVKDYEGLYANSHPFKVVNEGGGGGGDYDDFTGATASTAGEHGLVPAPKAGEQNKYLKGDGTWAEVQGGGGSGIPTDATFWGQSYDSVNNKVDGNQIILTQSGGAKSHITSSGSTGTSGNLILGVGTNYASSSRIGIKGSQIDFYAGSDHLRYSSSGLDLSTHKIINVTNPTAAQDAATKNYVDNLAISYAALNGSAAPTTATEGKYVGQLYYDTTNEDMYYLKAIDTTTTPATYTWDTIGGGGGGIPTNATFWGESYDSVNNKVDGPIKIRASGSGSTYNIIDLRPENGLGGMAVRQLNYDLGQNYLSLGIDLIYRTSLSSDTWYTYNTVSISRNDITVNRKISGVYAPTSGTDAANKQYVDTNIGDLTTLTTTAKTSAVAAINELASQVGNVETALNAINNGS